MTTRRPTAQPGVAETPSGEEARRQARDIIVDWIRRRQGSPAELIRELEDAVGWPARHMLLPLLDELRADKELDSPAKKFLAYTLNAGAVREALANGLDPNAGHQSSLDDLFMRSRRFRRSKKFAEAVEFVARFRDYSPFNNMLAFLQNPLATYFATASHWRKAFGRTIKDEARGMILLAPRTPVLVVYDIADTEGPALPRKLEVFTRASGRFDPAILDRTLKNCERDKIRVERKPMGRLRGGFATARMSDARWKLRIGLRDALGPAEAYAALCHELAHIYLGHLGADRDAWWPYRLDLPFAVTEIEAEAVAHIVCSRAGLRTHSAEYLSSFVDNDDLDGISLDLISRASGRIEEMGRRLLPPRDDAADHDAAA